MEISTNPSPLDYPYINCYLLPNITAAETIKSGSLRIFESGDENIQIDHNDENLQETEEILEPELYNLDKLSRYQKLLLILEKIKKNPLEVELKISFFYTSCKSIPRRILNEHLEYLNLIESFDDIPAVENLNNANKNQLSNCIVETLYWLLIGFVKPKIVKLNNLEEQWLCEEIDKLKILSPLFVCKLDGNQPFNDITRDGINIKTEYGFLPVNNREAFSLLFNWDSSAKNRCFNDKFHHAYNYSRLQPIWPKCSLGKWIKIIFIIEYYMHPTITYVGDVPGKTLSLSLELSSPDPPGYFLITNTDYARISHILIYQNSSSIISTIKTMFKHSYTAYSSLIYCLFGAIILAQLLKKIQFNRL